MRNPKTMLLLSVIVGVLLLGVAYAGIQNVNLTISGTATATPDQANFDVKFGEETTTSGSGTITAKRTGDLTATMSVSGLKHVGETATVTFKIYNYSPDLSAQISHKTTHTAEGYFDVSTEFVAAGYYPDNNVIAASMYQGGDIAHNWGTLTVTVSLKSLPIAADVSDNITITVTAKPIDPVS